MGDDRTPAGSDHSRYPGLDLVICATPLGTPLDVQLADLDRFAKEVIPAFRDTRTAAAAQ